MVKAAWAGGDGPVHGCGGGGEGSFTEPDDLEREEVSALGLSGQIGGGLAIGVAPSIEASADARYSHVFTDMLDGAKGDIRNWRSRDVRLTLGVLLHAPRLGGV